MALSLQEQLLQAGLTDKKKAKQVQQEQRKKKKQQQKHKVVEKSQGQLAAEQAKQEKIEKDRQLNLEAKKLAEQKAIQAQIKQLIEMNKQAKDNGDIPCNFTDNNVIKRLYVNQQTHNRVTAGKLAIVKLANSYELIPVQVADKIEQRDESVVLYRADKLPKDEAREATEDDDWYADYQIPDDLTW